ncbi:MAG: glyceraldehyde-3-phosphate dehydrogenase, partial [Gammaproteobacteria bacterium]
CMTTIHDLTNTQTIVDKGHHDLRRARACVQSLIPTTTGSARAITTIFPQLAGRLNGHAVRVPLLNGSLTDFVFEAARAVTAADINACLRTAAAGELAGILGYEERPLVSVDYLDDPRSAIVDALSTLVIDDTQVKIYAWYDNEWGYVSRLIDIARMLAASL